MSILALCHGVATQLVVLNACMLPHDTIYMNMSGATDAKAEQCNRTPPDAAVSIH
jgi:hypothetical protein